MEYCVVPNTAKNSQCQDVKKQKSEHNSIPWQFSLITVVWAIVSNHVLPGFMQTTVSYEMASSIR